MSDELVIWENCCVGWEIDFRVCLHAVMVIEVMVVS